MSWFQKDIKLKPRSQGCYLIDDEILSNLPELRDYKIGMLNLFMQHTSAGLILNENYDPDVRTDMKNALARIAPEGENYLHNDEGSDDMPAHVRSAVVGVSVNIPVKDGHLRTGTWQGIYLAEFRNYRHTRTVVATINGEKRK